MSRPRFLGDEDLRSAIISATRRKDIRIEFASVISLGLSGRSDHDVLEYAAESGMIVVSHDVNTMSSTARERVTTGAPMPGLFLVPQVRRTAEIAENLHLIWEVTEAEEWPGCIVFLPM